MGIERIPGPATASYSDAVAVDAPGGRWIFVSGQLPLDENATIDSTDLGEQTDTCLDHVERILASQGARLADVIRITAYLTSLDDYAAYTTRRKQRFGDALPASATVQVAGLLGGALIEIDAIAFVASGAGSTELNSTIPS
jgi:2-iminobutanoate/2-iminopropanoate deaminase